MDKEYYSKKLSANKLKKCYDVASPRIQQYLNEEISFVLQFIKSDMKVLELGCGYGRVLKFLADQAKNVVGIDTSQESLDLAEEYLVSKSNIELFNMNAEKLAFQDESFDIVIGIQNGISAFKVDPKKLVSESLRVVKKGGQALFSSYSDNIWDARLAWFQKQSEEGLLGEIDWQQTKNGTIVCKDGFVANTFTKKDFQSIISDLKLRAKIKEVDNSSIFCVIYKT
ncbi:MAG: class I SAM-dependent methyltransferase [Candidatus Heimdallarchaeota archaeon]